MGKDTILVVDDERDIRELVSYNLIKNGYKASAVASGEEALTRARDDQWDIHTAFINGALCPSGSKR